MNKGALKIPKHPLYLTLYLRERNKTDLLGLSEFLKQFHVSWHPFSVWFQV